MTGKQKLALALVKRKHSVAAIAEKLGITRQAAGRLVARATAAQQAIDDLLKRSLE